MIIAYHVIFTTYGTWLPNDPRGSFSTEIYNTELSSLGEIKYGRQAPQPHKRVLKTYWATARSQLSRKPFFIDDATRPVVAGGFNEVVRRLSLTVPACAIMNDHVHILVMRSKYKIEYIVGQLKGAATHALKLTRTPWARGCWKVFVDDEETLYAATRYIERNPINGGLTAQRWDFVKPLSRSSV